VNAVVTVGHLTVMQKAKESTTAKEKATKEAKKQKVTKEAKKQKVPKEEAKKQKVPKEEAKKQKVQKEKDPATITNQAEVHEALMKAVE